MTLIDTSSGFDKRVERRLAEESVSWLTKFGDMSGAPLPNPVWFVPTGNDELLIHSQWSKPKLRSISARPLVALAINFTASGGDIVTFQGEARVDHDAPAAVISADYLARYKVNGRHQVDRYDFGVVF